MPTNLYPRNTSPKRKSGPTNPPVASTRERLVALRIGRHDVTIKLTNSPTADRLWMALPLYSSAETWGEAVHFEIPMRSARDQTARINAKPDDVYFWPSDERIILAWGPTPISRPNETRLPEPCNVIATALDDLARLKSVTPGEKVSITKIK